jgi:glycerol-3-phosphate dehydrogenase subunit C
MVFPYTDRLNYVSPLINNNAYAMCVEKLLGIHIPEAKLVAEHVYDINEFLWLQYQEGQLKTDFIPQSGRYIPVHTSCHQKLHRIGRPALDLLALVPGLTVEEMGVDCCGIAGTYGYKHEKYDIARRVGQPLWDRLAASRITTAICDNETCRWNIANQTGLTVVHTMQVLAEAYGVTPR